MPTVRKRGKKWQAQVRVRRDGVIVHQESASFESERLALRWGHAVEARIAKLGVEQHTSGRTTVRDVLLAWIRFRESRSPMSRGLQHSTTVLLAAGWSDTPVMRLTAKALIDWAGGLGSAPSTVMHHFMVLRSAYAAAPSLLSAKPSMAPVNEAMDTLRRARVISPSQSRTRRVTDEELDRVVAHLRGKYLQVPTDTFVRLAVALPRRREELLTARWQDYDGQTLRLHDTKHPTKTRTEVIPVPPAARAIIDALPRLDDRILPYKPESVSAAFQRAVRAVGIEDLRLHDLRHEGISRLFEAGLQIQEVALISGHVSWTALRRYTHLRPLDVLEKLNARSQRAQEAIAEPAGT